MTQRIFLKVERGMTDKTAVCVFPWEKPILERIHGGNVEEVSLEEMCSLKGSIKVEKNKTRIKRENGELPETPPSLREQLVRMQTVDPDSDPAEDPAAEYNRLAMLYGMDKEVNLPVVTLIYGQFESGAFESRMKESAAKTARAKPAAAGKPTLEKPVEEMSINELRSALRAAGIEFDQTAKKLELADLLATATA